MAETSLNGGPHSGAADTTLASSLATSLRQAIMNGEIAPGAKLRLDELRESFGVSLSPLREALSRLGTEGLIVIEAQRGYRVAPVSKENLQEVTRLRCELESMALAESIRRGDDAWEEGLVAAFHRLQKTERLGRDTVVKLENWENAHRNFHAKLINACGMPILLQFCFTLHDLSDRYRRIFLQNKSGTVNRNVNDEHNKIMDAALARDKVAACEHLRSHIEQTGTNILRVLDVSS